MDLITSEAARRSALAERVGRLEVRAAMRRPATAEVAAVRAAADDIDDASFRWVPHDYYDRSLAERAALLGSPLDSLCKTMLLENTACPHERCDDPSDSRYYLVVVQYSAKFNAEALFKELRGLRSGDAKLPRSRFNLQVAPGDVCARLTGFAHGAVAPLGGKTRVPVVLAAAAAAVTAPAWLWFGGGDVNLKLGTSVKSFLSHVRPLVLPVSSVR